MDSKIRVHIVLFLIICYNENGGSMYANIYWVGSLNVIGGVETAIYELSKKFKDYEFVVYYKSIPKEQLKRLRKNVKCIKYNGEKLKCKKLFMNYDISIIDNVDAEEYIEIIHCVFSKNVAKPHTHSKINKYYAVSIEACESFKKMTGKECEVLHNPLQIDKPKKILRLISATRLATDKGKIEERTKKLCEVLEVNGIPYEWKIYTNSPTYINDSVIMMKPTLDIRNNIADSDYLVQLSDTEAFCYSVLESLYLNVPVIVTPIKCFEEMGVENGKNGYIVDFDMNNIPVDDIYNNIPKFEYQSLKDEWDDKIVKVKSDYKEEDSMVKVRALKSFERIKDAERNVYPKEGEIWEVEQERADFLLQHGVIEIVEEKKEEKDVIVGRIEYPKEDIELKVEFRPTKAEKKTKKSSKK